MSILGRLTGHGDPHSLAAPYVLDALEPGERRRFAKHLRDCERCATEVRALAEDAVRLAWSTAAPAPAALRDRVLAAVRAIPQEPAPDRASQHAERERNRSRERTSPLPPHVWGTQPPPGRARTPRTRPLFVPLATATAAAALVVASLFAVQAHHVQGRLDAAQVRAREMAHVLAAPDARATNSKDAQGRGIGVIASASEREAVVTLSGYGAPPDGRVRQLWLMRPRAQPRSLGLFAGDTPLLAKGLDLASTSLAVTVESDGGSAQPTGQPIVQLTLKSVGFGE
ncbi:anti-sigma factor [Streptomyces broussonetiae]|uniref:Regulator of SigK n=1 Tax=Streptomyces broussonetiae TaxID=2686304 RepID=A0A6I6MZN4_9ACTN|nr:anti-sigma factor [Streptomyces broussonetiae]QHA03789.1 anti-sigma factor [Streptomyces broussonetiae]